MMTPFAIMLSNAVLATILAGLVYLLAKCARHPPLVHALWVLVLVKLITPPVLSWPVPMPAPMPASVIEREPPEALPPELGPPPEEDPATISLAREPLESPIALPAGTDNGLAPRGGQVTGHDASCCVVWAIWLGGCLVYLQTCRRRRRRLHRLLQHAEPAPSSWQQQAKALARQLGLRRAPSVWHVPEGLPPMVAFDRRGPRIVLPSPLLERLDGKGRAAILLHELAHVRRRDPWIHRLELAVRAIYWWYPVVGWIGRQLHAAEEACCDGLVVRSLPDGRRDYAQLLVDIADALAGAPRQVIQPKLAMSAFSTLERRLTMVLKESLPARLSWRWALVVVALGILALPVGVCPADADAPAVQDTARPATGLQPASSEPGIPPPKSLVHKLPSDGGRLEMTAMTSRILAAEFRIPRVQVGDSDLVGLVPLSPTEIQVSAKKAGETRLLVWDAEDKLHAIEVVVSDGHAYTIRVRVVELDGAGGRKVLAEPTILVAEGRRGYVHVGGEALPPSGLDTAEPLCFGTRFEVRVYRKDGRTYLDGTLRFAEVLKADKSGVRLAASEVRLVEPVTLGKQISVRVPSPGPKQTQIGLELTITATAQPEEPPSTEAGPPSVPSTLPDAKHEAKGLDQAWRLFGMRLLPIKPREFRKLKTRYRGGMRVAEVRPDGPAAKQGVRRGDVLVGLHVWETTSGEQIEYVLSRPDLEEISPIKFFLIRGNETLYGHLPLGGQAVF